MGPRQNSAHGGQGWLCWGWQSKAGLHDRHERAGGRMGIGGDREPWRPETEPCGVEKPRVGEAGDAGAGRQAVLRGPGTFPLSPCLRSGLLPRQAPCKAPPPSEAAPLPGSRSSPSSEVLTGPAHAAWSQGEPWPRTHHPQRPGTCDFGQGTTAPTWLLFQVAQP